MKRFLAIMVLVLMVVSSAAAEDIDLSGLSFDQLIQLQSRITMEIMQRDEWQEVTVPAGVYVIGKDIPAGSWSVEMACKGSCEVLLYPNKEESENEFGFSLFDVVLSEYIEKTTVGKLDLKNGNILVLSGDTIFRPFTGMFK